MLSDQVERVVATSRGTQREIGQFVLDHASKLTDFTVKAVAVKTYTSEASVVRFAQRLGFKKWREFAQNYVQSLIYQQQNSSVNANLPFTKQSSLPNVIDSVMALKVDSLKLTSQLLNPEVVLTSAQCLDQAQRVVIFSEVPNYYLAESFKRKLLSVGKHIEVAHSGEYGLQALSLTADDCVIMISYSGSEFIEPVVQVKQLKAQHVKVIAITSEADNFLSRHADYQLAISTNEHLYTKITNYATETAINYIFDVLFSVVFQQHFDDNLRYRMASSDQLEKARVNKNMTK